MALVSLLEPEEMAPAARDAVLAGASQVGAVLHTWQAIAHRPEAMAAYLPYLRAVAGPGTVEQRTKELTAVEVTLLNHCRYSCSHRVRAARGAGVEEHELVALGQHEYSRFDPREQVALRLAREMTLLPPRIAEGAAANAVSADLLRAAKLAFEDRQLVELCLDISLWNALTRFHRVMEFELDLGPVPPSLEARLRT